MTTKTHTSYALIGNGLAFPTRRKRSLLEEYRAKQAACAHTKRDPSGMCYDCGHREADIAIHISGEGSHA